MDYLSLTLAAIFWGGNYVVGHLLVKQADPILMTEARWTLTALLLVFLYWRGIVNNRKLVIRSWRVIFFLALFGQVLFPLTLYIGLQYTSSLNAAIYMSATPSMVLLINKLCFRERISRNNILGVVLSSVGVLYLVMKGHLTQFSIFNQLNIGDLWAMGSALSWAFYCSFLRLKTPQLSGNVFVATSSVVGMLILLPILLYYSHVTPSIDTSAYHQPDFLVGLVYLVIFPSWLSYVLWNKGIQAIGATRGEIYTHIIPLSGGLMSIMFLNTPLAQFHIISAILIACGITLCSKKQRDKQLFQHQGQ